MARPILAALALFGLVFLAPGLLPLDGPARTARASVSLEMDLDALLKRTHLVVIGTPTEAHGAWETGDGGRRIVTYSRLSIERIVDGRLDRSETWVRSLGGTVGDIGQKVFGEAELALGHPALLFLRARGDGTHVVVGLAQGELPIETSSDGIRRIAPNRQIGGLVPPGPVSLMGAQRELAGLSLDDAADRVVMHRGRVGVTQ